MKRYLSTTILLLFSVMVFAGDLDGLKIYKLQKGSKPYVQSLDVIGRVELRFVGEEQHAFVVYKDKKVAEEDMGEISGLRSIVLTSIKEEDIPTDVVGIESSIEVSAYPNPTSNVLHIKGMKEGQKAYLFSLQGKMLMSTSDSEINIGGQPNGIYLLKIGTEIIKIIKQ